MTYASSPPNLRQILICWNSSPCKTRFSAPLAIFQGTHQSENCIRLSIFPTFTIILQNYAGNKHKFLSTFGGNSTWWGWG
jgi:hypothetical protein